MEKGLLKVLKKHTSAVNVLRSQFRTNRNPLYEEKLIEINNHFVEEMMKLIEKEGQNGKV